MSKEKSSYRFAVPVLIVAIVLRMVQRRMEGPEPAACTVMRTTLLTTQKIDTWMMEKEPTKTYDIPHIPFQIIQDCGWRSFKMPYAFKFTFLEEPLDEDELVAKFLERNKQVEYRDVLPGINANFGIGTSNKAIPRKGLFEEAWKCISKGKCSMYFDNSWSKKDYESILPKNVVDTLTHGIKFGTMFMANPKKYILTAALHATGTQSLATQMTGAKTWIFIPPYVVKKYLYPITTKALSVTAVATGNETEILRNIPHFTVTANAGEGIYFPGYWYHIVYSHEGLNTMTNWRQVNSPIDQFMASPYPLIKNLKLTAVALAVRFAPKALVVKIHAARAPFRRNHDQDMYKEMIYKASVNFEDE